MSDKKISQLPSSAPLVGIELLAGVQNAGNVAITPSRIATYIGLSTSTTAVTSVLSLTNGLNSNIALPTTKRVLISGPTGAFSIGGFVGGVDGMRLYIFNPLSQTMTIVNEDASSTAANRITTLIGANIVMRTSAPSFVTLSYDGASGRFIIENFNGAAA